MMLCLLSAQQNTLNSEKGKRPEILRYLMIFSIAQNAKSHFRNPKQDAAEWGMARIGAVIAILMQSKI
jgi:hypothetical protein